MRNIEEEDEDDYDENVVEENLIRHKLINMQGVDHPRVRIDIYALANNVAYNKVLHMFDHGNYLEYIQLTNYKNLNVEPCAKTIDALLSKISYHNDPKHYTFAKNILDKLPSNFAIW